MPGCWKRCFYVSTKCFYIGKLNVKTWSKTIISIVSLIIVIGLSGCAHFFSSHTYGVRFINHTDGSIMFGYIQLGSYKGLAGGGAGPGQGGGRVALLGLRKLPKRASFTWNPTKGPKMRAELIIPSLPKPPENLGTYCCDLEIHILPDNQVKSMTRIAYVDLEGKYQELFNEGPTVMAVQDERYGYYY